MAMTKCKECGASISTKAEACPQCGAKRPKQTSGCAWIALIFLGIPILWAVVKTSSTPPAPRIPDEQCIKDLACWANRHDIEAQVQCRKAIARQAKFDIQWTDGVLTPMFHGHSWADQSKGVVRYVGDQVKLQNGFGAWAVHTYGCDFDPATESVLAVKVLPGKFR